MLYGYKITGMYPGKFIIMPQKTKVNFRQMPKIKMLDKHKAMWYDNAQLYKNEGFQK